jgi:hypothetical protein
MLIMTNIRCQPDLGEKEGAVPGAAGEDLHQGTTPFRRPSEPGGGAVDSACQERWKTYSPGAGPSGR